MTAFPAELFDDVQEITVEAAPLAVVRHSGLRLSGLSDVFDPAYAALGRAIADASFSPAGPALAVYHGDPMGVFDLEIGFPVTAPLSEVLSVDGVEIAPSALPAGPALAASHIGAYDGLGPAWGRLYGDVAQRQRRGTGDWIEIYVTDPRSAAPAELRTDLVLRTV